MAGNQDGDATRITPAARATGTRQAHPPCDARAAVAAGADGIIVEVHPDPARAVSDGKQSLKPEKFAEMVRQVKAIAEVMGRRIAPVNKPLTVGW